MARRSRRMWVYRDFSGAVDFDTFLEHELDVPAKRSERKVDHKDEGPRSYLIGKRTSLNWRCIYLRNDTNICVEDDMKPDVGHFSFVADSTLRVSTIFVGCPPINQAGFLHLTSASFWQRIGLYVGSLKNSRVVLWQGESQIHVFPFLIWDMFQGTLQTVLVPQTHPVNRLVCHCGGLKNLKRASWKR